MTVAQIQQTTLVSALAIGGSDGSGGAGVQADLLAFAAHGVHGLSAITALTAQNTRVVTEVFVPPAAILRRQIEVLFDDFRIGAVKTGMLATRETIQTVADVLEARSAANLIVDPVMIASSGASLLDADALDTLRTRLLPRATLLTPNLPEAEALLGGPVRDAADAAHALRRLGPRAVLLKGGHASGDDSVDWYCDEHRTLRFARPRLPLQARGTGCTLAAAIAALLALGHDPADACQRAGDYVHGALVHATRPGQGLAVLNRFWNERGRG